MTTEPEQRPGTPTVIPAASEGPAPSPGHTDPAPHLPEEDTPMPPRDPASAPPSGSDGQKTEDGKSSDPAVPTLVPHPHSFHGASHMQTSGPPLPLTLNQVAIVTASHNKLPVSRLQAIVTRMSRHTTSSASKRGRWYKSDNYVDNANYSWRNMELFIDYQKNMYTDAGTVKSSCKK